MNLRSKLDEAKGRRNQLQAEFDTKKQERKQLKSLNEGLVKAKWVLTEVQRITQETFKDRVEKLVTMAIRSVFDREFDFVLQFERKRGKLEIQPIVTENGNEYIPKEDMGGGILPIIGLALRVVLWSLEKPRSRNIIILDEPTLWLGKLVTKFGAMLKEVSKGLGFQVLMSTHDEELLLIGDRIWEFKNDGSGTVVTQVNNWDAYKKSNASNATESVRKLRRE